jgi:acyl-CoA reductase-like NAD-dependent aldehyde dehydrogenase
MHKTCNQNREERLSTAEPKTVRLFINGRWCQPSQPEYSSEVTNPATGEIIAKVVAARIEDVNDAVESACAAFPKRNPDNRMAFVSSHI